MSINISEDLLTSHIQRIVLNTQGVSGLAGKGVKTDIDTKSDLINVNVTIDVYYGTHIPSVAWNVQKRANECVIKYAGKAAESINITIKGVKRRRS